MNLLPPDLKRIRFQQNVKIISIFYPSIVSNYVLIPDLDIDRMKKETGPLFNLF